MLLIVALDAPIAPGALAQSAVEAEEHAERGAKFAARNDLKTAEAEFRRAVKLSPDNLPYLANLGSILGMEHRLKESTFYLRRALKLDPSNIALQRDLASNEWQAGQLKEARENLKHILAAKPGDPRTILLLGMVSESLQNYGEAVRLLNSVPALTEKQPESIIALARADYGLGQKERARQVLNELVGNPSGDRGLFLGAMAAADWEDYETAERLLRLIRSAYPDRLTLAYELARVRYREGRFDQCVRSLDTIPTRERQSVDALSLLALCYHKQGQERLAMQTMNEAMERIPHAEAAYLRVANMLLDNKLPVAAYKVAKSAVELAPESAKAYQLKGTVELKLYYYTDAIRTLSRALRLDPSSADADLGLALAEWGAGEAPEAEATFEEGIKRFPRDARHYAKYAQFLLEQGKLGGDTRMQSRAVTLLEHAISLEPSLAAAHYELGNFLLSKGETHEALRQLKEAAKLDPADISTRYALARAYRRLGRKEEAAKEMRLFAELKAKQNGKP